MPYLRTGIFLFVANFLLIAAIPADTFAQNEPLGLYLTWQQDPSTTMTIDWHTTGTTDETILEYRKKDKTRWQNKSGSNHEFPYSKRTINRVELTGLDPDSKYEFRFSEDSRIYKFRTMPETLSRPLRIAIGGDTMHFILLTIDGTHQHLLTIDDEGNIIDEYHSSP